MVLLMVTYFLGLQFQKQWEIRKEVKKLEQDIASFEGKNQELRLLVDYFQTTEYHERQARSLLNLQKPGEFAVALPEYPEDKAPPEQKVEKRSGANLSAWWDYFFKSE